MRPVRIKGSDPTPLGAPPDWKEKTDSKCVGLFIRREKIDGVPYMRSAWEPDPTDFAYIACGAEITLGIAGTSHPVVQVGVSMAPADFDPVVTVRKITHASGLPLARVQMLFAHNGVSRASADVLIETTYAAAIAKGVTMCEELAISEGWIT